MLSRRVFGGMLASTLAMRGWAQGSAADLSSRFSVMIWVLKTRGTFEENLERVAQAGYKHIELVGEFFSWSEAERPKVMAKMSALGITVDSTAGMKVGFADPAGGDAFLAELKRVIAGAKTVGCRQLILLSGKKLEGVTDEAQRAASVAALKRAAVVFGGGGDGCGD